MNSIEPSSKTNFVRNSALFSASRVFGAFVGLIRSFLIARILGPTAYGTWQFVNIYGKYGPYANLGTSAGISVRIPFLRGKGAVEESQRVASTAFVTNFVGAIIFGAGVFGSSLFVKESFDAHALAGYSAVIVVVIWLQYALKLSMSTALYGVRTRLEIVYDSLTALFGVCFAYFWGVHGVIAGFLLAALISVFIAARRLWQYVAFRIDVQILRDLIVTGLPVMANGLLLTAMATADRILIAAMLSRDMLGIYSVGFAGVAVLRTIPVSVGQMLFVKFAELHGQEKRKEYVLDVLEKSTFVLSSVLAPILCVVIAAFPMVIVLLLPEFEKGIIPGRFLIAEVFFLGVSLPMTNWCVSTGRFEPVLRLRLIVLAAEFVSVYLVIVKGGELKLIALSVLSASAIFCGAIIITGYRLHGNYLWSGVKRATKNMLPFLSVVLGIWVQDYFYFSDPGGDLFVACFFGFLVSMPISLPFVFWANRRTRVLEVARKDFVRSSREQEKISITGS